MGLEDLQGFKILSNDEVRNHFFSVEGGERIGVARRDLSRLMAFSSQIEPLPLILDDILVRFDEQRQQEALQFLAELGKIQQIFLFTCSAQTRRIATQVEQQQGADTGVIHLYEVSRGTIQPYAKATE